MAKRRKAELIIAGDNKGGVRALRETGDAADGLSGKLGTVGKVGGAVFAGLAVGAGVFAASAVKDFAEFEAGMNEVFTLMPGITGQAMGEMEQQVKDFSVEFGVLPDDVIPSLYDSISAGVPADNVFSFLETAQKAAKGGATDIGTAVDGLSSVVNAYGADVITAGQASDEMFTAVRLGKTNFEELSASLFQVAPMASSLGVQFGDVSASLATLTSMGTPTAVAATQMKAALAELGKEGTKASDAFAQAAGMTFPEFMAQGGNLEEALHLMANAAGENGQSVLDMFGSIEAGQGVLALTGQGADAFSTAMSEMANSAGATDAAFETMDQGLSSQFQKMMAQFEVFKLDVGGALAPLATELMDALSPLMRDLAPIIKTVAEHLGGVLGHNIEALMPSVLLLAEAFAPMLPLLADLVAMIVDALAPVLASLIEALAPVVTMMIEALQPVLEQLKPVFDDLSLVLIDFIEQGIVPMLPALMELSLAFLPLLPPLTELTVLLVSALLPILGPLIGKFAEITALFAGALSEGVVWLSEKFAAFNDWLREVIGKPDELRANFVRGLDVIRDKAGSVMGWVQEKFAWFLSLPETLWDAANRAGVNLANGVIGGINAIIGAWNSLKFEVPGFDPPGPGSFPGFTLGVPPISTIPYIAAEAGALLTAPTLLLAGETAKARAGGGEVVSPVDTMRGAMRAELNAGGGGDVVVNVNVAGGLYGDARQFGREVAAALQAYRRSGGSMPWR